MIFPVRDQNVPVGVDGDALQALELGGAGAPLAEAAQVGPVGVEDLDAVVAAVSNEDVALVVNGDAPKDNTYQDK